MTDESRDVLHGTVVHYNAFDTERCTLGYCTNVHAGTDVESILVNLRTHAVPARQWLGTEQLGIGLWFSERAAQEALQPESTRRLREELARMGLVPFTFNGFPQGDFHQAVVKHRVYQPPWWDPARAQYTKNLIQLMQHLLPPDRSGSISTLPIAWGDPAPTPDQWRSAAEALRGIAAELHRVWETTGQRIVVALEPEPGCALTHTPSLRKFFDEHLCGRSIPAAEADAIRRHLTLCHDICHAAVMCEDQRQELSACRKQGIRVGKVQVSSAIGVDWESRSEDERRQIAIQLGEFAEDRYLHQTMVRDRHGALRLFEDLPSLLADPNEQRGQWRIHFHVPIYLTGWGAIQTTQSEIQLALEILLGDPDLSFSPLHLEVETYAWGVLPAALRVPDLHTGIAREIQWLASQLTTPPLSERPRS